MAGPEVQSAASEPIFGKKFMNKLGGMANEAAASTVSAFARKQMEKMGWSEGKGLGKEEQGVVTHVRVKKREEFMGVGVEKVNLEETKNQWWYNAYDKIADKIKIAADSDDDDAGGKTKKKKKSSKKKSAKKLKRKREEEEMEAAGGDAAREKKFRIPTDEELFAATGGKLFGRRAYGSCNGKLKRDELLQLKDKQSKASKSKISTSASSSGDEDTKKQEKKKAKKLAKVAKKAKGTSSSDSD